MFKIFRRNGEAGLKNSWQLAVGSGQALCSGVGKRYTFAGKLLAFRRNYLIEHFIRPQKKRLAGFKQLLYGLAAFEVFSLRKGKTGFYIGGVVQ